MKYKLINKTTGEEHLCDKVIVDGWDYYVSDDLKVGDKVRLKSNVNVGQVIDDVNKDWHLFWFKPIATNNPDIDIPKVVKEVEILAKQNWGNVHRTGVLGFIEGYNKSQETHPFSEEDMIDFATFRNGGNVREEFNLWKEQRTKILYYE